LVEVGDADVLGEGGVLTLKFQKHLPGDAAIAEVASGAGAELGDVLRFGKVHFEQGANAGGERVEVGGGLRGLLDGGGGDYAGGAVGGGDGIAVVGEDAGFGEDVGTGRKVTGAESFIAMQGGEVLDDLRAAAMAMEIAEATNVHEDVKADGRAGMEGAEGFVVLAAVPQAQLDDFDAAGGGLAGEEVANLAVGVVAGGVEKGGGELDLERLGALDEIDERSGGGRQVLEELGGGASEIGPGLDEVFAGLGVFDEGGRGADFACEEGGGLGGESGRGIVVENCEPVDDGLGGVGVEVPGGAGGGFAELFAEEADFSGGVGEQARDLVFKGAGADNLAERGVVARGSR